MKIVLETVNNLKRPEMATFSNRKKHMNNQYKK